MTAPTPQGETRLGSISPQTRCTLALGALLAAFATWTAGAGAAGASAAEFEPFDVRVNESDQAWFADSHFVVRWSNPPGVAAVRYRLLGPGGEAIGAATRVGWAAAEIEHLAVPPTPGAYAAEIRLEDGLGALGPPLAAPLRFDDLAPGPVSVPALPAWIGAPSLPLEIELGQPGGAAPLSGIRGYAVSVDPLAGSSPCAGPTSCTPLETDLQAGPAASTVTLAELPEGTSHLNAVAVSGSGVRSASVASATLRVDRTAPRTALSGLPAGWSRGPVTLTASASDGGSGMDDGLGPEPFTAIRVDGGAPALAAGDRVATTVIGSGLHRVAAYARDAAGNVADGAQAGGRRNPAPTVASVAIDAEAPSLAFARAQSPADPEAIEARVADRLSGVDPSRGKISVRPAGSAERFRPLPTSLSGARLSARWDSAAYPRGEYEFRAVAYDRAGNRATSASRAGGAPMRLRAPLKGAVRLAARIVRRRGRTLLRGRALSGRRAQLAGAAVTVTESFDPGSPRAARRTTVRTGPGGGFGLRLGPGPSRGVVASLQPTATLNGARSATLRVEVPGRLRLRASARVARVGGKPVVFSGRARGPVPAEGKLVELQFRLPGLPWAEFRTLRTDRRGRFRYRYRFADDDSRGVSFRFRAYAPAQAGWPFGPAGSRPVTVRGV